MRNKTGPWVLVARIGSENCFGSFCLVVTSRSGWRRSGFIMCLRCCDYWRWFIRWS